MMRKMANKKRPTQESSSCESSSPQALQGSVLDCESILQDGNGEMKEADELHYIYLVRCADDSLYCGWTTDLKRRIDAHNGLIPGGAKYMRGRRPVELVYSESFHNKQDAQRREYAIKQMTKTKKLRLIEGAK